MLTTQLSTETLHPHDLAMQQREMERDELAISVARKEIDGHSAHDLFNLDPEQRTVVNSEFDQAMEDPRATHFLREMIHEGDLFTWTHTVEVAKMAIAIGHEVGLDKDTLHHVAVAALVHDIGKISKEGSLMREAIDSPGKLSDEQREEIRKHPKSGYENYLKMGGDPNSLEAGAILHHHDLKRAKLSRKNTKEKLTNSRKQKGLEVIVAADVVQSLASRSYVNNGVKLTPAQIHKVLIDEVDLDESIFNAVHELLGLGKAPDRVIDIRHMQLNLGNRAVNGSQRFN